MVAVLPSVHTQAMHSGRVPSSNLSLKAWPVAELRRRKLQRAAVAFPLNSGGAAFENFP